MDPPDPDEPPRRREIPSVTKFALPDPIGFGAARALYLGVPVDVHVFLASTNPAAREIVERLAREEHRDIETTDNVTRTRMCIRGVRYSFGARTSYPTGGDHA